MAVDARRELLVYTDTTGVALTADVSGAIDAAGIDVPILVVVRSSDIGTAPTSPTVDVQMKQSGDGTNFTDVSGWAITQIATAGEQLAVDEQTVQVARWLQVDVTTTYGTAADGTKVEVWLVGTAR